MKNIIKFLVISLAIYFILSLPMMLGYGVEICFVKEVSLFTKFKAYLFAGLQDGYLIKLLISIAATAILLIVSKMKKK